MQFGLTTFLFVVTSISVVSNRDVNHLVQELRIETCVKTLTSLSEFEKFGSVDNAPNPCDIIRFANQIRILGNQGATEAMHRFCDRFPIENGSRTTLLDWLIPLFWTSDCELRPEPFYRYEWRAKSDDSSTMYGNGISRYVLVDDIPRLPNVITIVDGIPFENKFLRGLVGNNFGNRKYLVEWARLHGRLNSLKLSPPDNPVKVLEKTTKIILADPKRWHAEYVQRYIPAEYWERCNWQDDEWTKTLIRDHLCNQLYELTKPAIPAFEKPQVWFDKNCELDHEFRKLEDTSKTVYWNANSKSYRRRPVD